MDTCATSGYSEATRYNGLTICFKNTVNQRSRSFSGSLVQPKILKGLVECAEYLTAYISMKKTFLKKLLLFTKVGKTSKASGGLTVNGPRQHHSCASTYLYRVVCHRCPPVALGTWLRRRPSEHVVEKGSVDRRGKTEQDISTAAALLT